MQKDDLISRQAAIDALDVLCQEHRYRIPGKRETYSQYNEAWQDALDRAEGAIGNLPSAQPGCEDAVSRADVDILIEEAQTAWLRGDILLMYPALKKGLQKVPSVTPKQPGWIPVTERLPEDDRPVLVTLKWSEDDYEVTTGEYWRDSTVCHGWGNFGDVVIAWQLLPTPYREGGQE